MSCGYWYRCPVFLRVIELFVVEFAWIAVVEMAILIPGAVYLMVEAFQLVPLFPFSNQGAFQQVVLFPFSRHPEEEAS
jgi:hypothetical protein